MKIFAIKSDHTGSKVLGYLLYYEKTKQFYIELLDQADEWETPLLLSSFVKRGQKTVNSYWSLVWVRQRIIPTDRQNLGSILRENGLSEYDEYSLLELAEGRCAQDDCYIEPMEERCLPAEILNRFQIRVEEAVPLADRYLLVFFRNGSARKCNMQAVCTEPRFASILLREELFSAVSVQTDGYGITWGENLEIDANRLWQEGTEVPLSLADFQNYAAYCVTDTSGACRLLNCSRQNISDLVRRGKLHPIRSSSAGALFLMSELRQRLWQ